MSREIKFRGWMKDQTPAALASKTFPMYYFGWPRTHKGISWSDIFDGKPRVIESFLSNDKSVLDQFEIMQFTGLKDKNGKDIYEGDILEIGTTNNVGNSENKFTPVTIIGSILAVSFDSGCFTTAEGILSDLMIWQKVEVIGNIYEDSELLKP